MDGEAVTPVDLFIELLYDSDWNPLSNTQVVDGTWTRPHSVIVNDTLYVGYDGSSNVQLSGFDITPAITTPTPSPSVTPISTATPVCVATSIVVSPNKLTLSKKASSDVTVKITGEDGCSVEGERVTAKIAPSGKRLLSISSLSEITDANGEATFTITA